MLALCACIGRGPTNSGADLHRLAIDGVLHRSARSMPLDSTSLTKTEVESVRSPSPLDGRIGKYCLETVRSGLERQSPPRRKDVAGEHKNGNDLKPKAKDAAKRKPKAKSSKKKAPAAPLGHDNTGHANLVDMTHQKGSTKADHEESPLALRILNDRIRASSTVMAALSAFQVMLREQIKPNDQTFLSLYKVCKDKKDGKRAWKLYEIMNNSEVAASQMTFGTLLAALAGAGMVTEAQAIKGDMEQRQIGLDGYAYASLINMYRNAKMDSEDQRIKARASILEALEEMKQQGITPNTVHYNGVIDGLFKAGDPSKALSVYQDIMRRGVDLKEATFNIVIRGLGNAGEIEEMFSVFEQMSNKWVVPSKLTYNCVIAACAANGQAPGHYRRALEIFKEMGEKLVEPDIGTFHNVMLCAIRLGRPKLVFRSHDLLRKRGISETKVTWNLLLEACSRIGGRDGLGQAMNILELMRQSSAKITVSVVRTLLEICASAGNINKALSIVQLLEKGTSQANEDVLPLLLDACRASGDPENYLKLTSLLSKTAIMPLGAQVYRDTITCCLADLSEDFLTESAQVFRAVEPPEVRIAMRLYQQAQSSGFLEDYSPSNPFHIQVCPLHGIEYITVVILSALVQLRMSPTAACRDLELAVLASSASKKTGARNAADSTIRSILQLLAAASVPMEMEEQEEENVSCSDRALTRIEHDDNGDEASSLTRLIVSKDAIQTWLSNPISFHAQ